MTTPSGFTRNRIIPPGQVLKKKNSKSKVRVRLSVALGHRKSATVGEELTMDTRIVVTMLITLFQASYVWGKSYVHR